MSAATKATNSTAAQATGTVLDPTLRAAVLGTCLVVWLLAVFAVLAINGVRRDLRSINTSMASMAAGVAGQNLAGLTVVDGDGKEVYALKAAVSPVCGSEGAGSCGTGGGCGGPGMLAKAVNASASQAAVAPAAKNTVE